jgi:hypothetical protein
MSKVVIDCPLCGSKMKVRVEHAPQMSGGRRLLKKFVRWWCQPVDVDSPESSFRSELGTGLW